MCEVAKLPRAYICTILSSRYSLALRSKRPRLGPLTQAVGKSMYLYVKPRCGQGLMGGNKKNRNRNRKKGTPWNQQKGETNATDGQVFSFSLYLSHLNPSSLLSLSFPTTFLLPRHG